MSQELAIESRVALAIQAAMNNKPGMLMNIREELITAGWSQFAVNELIQRVGIMVFNETPPKNEEKN